VKFDQQRWTKAVTPSTTFGQTEKKMPRKMQGIICFLVARGGIDQG